MLKCTCRVFDVFNPECLPELCLSVRVECLMCFNPKFAPELCLSVRVFDVL